MSNLTVQNIIDRARYRYNAVNDDFFTDSELMDLIFDGQAILAKEGWVIEKTYTTAAIDGTRAYTYPTTTLAIKEIRHDYDVLRKTKLKLDPKTSATEAEGTPREYALWQDTIYLYPTPDTDGSLDGSGNRVNYIDIKVYKYPDAITSTADLIEVPEEYKEDLIYFMLQWMAMKDQNTVLSDRYKLLWDEAVLRAKKQRKKRLRGDMNTRVSDYYFGSDVPSNVDEAFYYNRGY